MPFVYAGAAILHAGLFRRNPPGACMAMSPFVDRAAEAQGRLFEAFVSTACGMHVGTPEAVGEATEAAIVASAA